MEPQKFEYTYEIVISLPYEREGELKAKLRDISKAMDAPVKVYRIHLIDPNVGEVGFATTGYEENRYVELSL